MERRHGITDGSQRPGPAVADKSSRDDPLAGGRRSSNRPAVPWIAEISRQPTIDPTASPSASNQSTSRRVASRTSAALPVSSVPNRA
jgi:hypothetical protein